MSLTLGYLGPAGSNTEDAAIKYDSIVTRVPFDSINKVAKAVESGEVDEGIVPIENSLHGSVTDTVDMLIHDILLSIRQELVLPIRHFLMVKPGTKLQDIRVVFSHPQALAQCNVYLSESLSSARPVASLSTSASVQDMLTSSIPAGALATERAAELYGAEIVHSSIQNDQVNTTRFVVLSPHDHVPTCNDKTSICFDFDADSPGMLLSVLSEFANRDINLTKIESRPTRTNLGRYVFLVDFEGHRLDSKVEETLGLIDDQVSMFKIFGSYPMSVSSSVV